MKPDLTIADLIRRMGDFGPHSVKALGRYYRNRGVSIVIGRKKDIPKELQREGDIILTRDCVKGLKRKDARGLVCGSGSGPLSSLLRAMQPGLAIEAVQHHPLHPRWSS